MFSGMFGLRTGPARMDQLKSYTDDGKFYISTNDTPDAGLETMVFACDESGCVTDWADLDVAHYSTVDEATLGHSLMLARWNGRDIREALNPCTGDSNECECTPCLTKFFDDNRP